MKIGERREIRRVFTTEDVGAIAALGGGTAGDTVPEPLIAALFSYLLGVELPGPGTNYLKQEIVFAAPAPLGAPLVASVEVIRLRPEKGLVDLWAAARLEDGTLVAEGRSLVKFADLAKA
ncbi:phosphate acetyltransferase [Pseudoroseicyclus tamaricis]|nr:phosphate acetyltransferase [Pseudoroseicyclus tamaricis]